MGRMKREGQRVQVHIQLEKEADGYLDAESRRTGKSRSDIANRAIMDQQDFWPRIEKILEDQKNLMISIVGEVREIHKDRRNEHDQMLQLLEEIKNIIPSESRTTNE